MVRSGFETMLLCCESELGSGYRGRWVLNGIQVNVLILYIQFWF